jgi:hypothetical protein
VEAAAAIGRIAEKETLPEDLREREKPNDRKPLSDIAFEGNLQASRNSQFNVSRESYPQERFT